MQIYFVTVLRLFSICFLCSLQVLASGRINKIFVAEGQVELTIDVTPGEQYQVQCCTNLVDGLWVDVGLPFVASGNTAVRQIDSDTSGCWFRVVGDVAAGTEEPPDPDQPPDLPPNPPPKG